MFLCASESLSLRPWTFCLHSISKVIFPYWKWPILSYFFSFLSIQFRIFLQLSGKWDHIQYHNLLLKMADLDFFLQLSFYPNSKWFATLWNTMDISQHLIWQSLTEEDLCFFSIFIIYFPLYRASMTSTCNSVLQIQEISKMCFLTSFVSLHI